MSARHDRTRTARRPPPASLCTAARTSSTPSPASPRARPSGQGGALTVVGEAGIGKTAVVDEAADLVLADQPDSRIMRLRGVEAEVELAWSGLAELLDGVLDGIARLAPARASAVRAALAMEGTEQPVEPFAIALATRDLLVDAAEDAPIVVIVDDLQWVDLPTRRTLSYIARRLQFERLAIVSTRRAGADSHTDTGPVVVLDAVRRRRRRRASSRDAGVDRGERATRAGGGGRRHPARAHRGGQHARRRPAGRADRAARSAADRVVRPARRRPAAGAAAAAVLERPARGRRRARRRPRAHPQRPARAGARASPSWRRPRSTASSSSTATGSRSATR